MPTPTSLSKGRITQEWVTAKVLSPTDANEVPLFGREAAGAQRRLIVALDRSKVVRLGQCSKQDLTS